MHRRRFISRMPQQTRQGIPKIFLILACLLGNLTAVETTVTVVLSSDAEPYRQAALAATQRLGDHVQTTTILMDALRGAAPTSRFWITIGTPAALRLRPLLGPEQRLIYCLVTDPTGAGLTTDPRIHGISATVPLTTQFALLGRVRPTCRKVGILVLENRPDRDALQNAVTTALPSGWEARFVVVPTIDKIADQISTVCEGTDAVWTYADSGLYTDASVRMLLLTALRRRVPVFGYSPSFVRAGALVGVGIDPARQGEQAGELTASLMTDPDIPSQHRPPQHQVVINTVVARKIGLDLAPDVLAAADIIVDGTR